MICPMTVMPIVNELLDDAGNGDHSFTMSCVCSSEKPKSDASAISLATTIC